jgi:isopentenyl diphosphate isomerase/L-lactate dehydrogenase-like FMN-dependent dehydrogenase
MPRLPAHRFVTIEDFRLAARRRLPRAVFDYIDGGVRRGADAVRALEILRTDMVRTLRLLGCASLDELNWSHVQVPAGWTAGVETSAF